MEALASKAITSPAKVAEQLFREALDRLVTAIPGPDRLVAYALDRVGLACQLQGNDADAESLYLRSLALQQSGEWRATPWTEVTLLNLAILYGRQGRHAMNEALIRQMDELQYESGPVAGH
jgi:tetratricopeptide (TPR) repeat protein